MVVLKDDDYRALIEQASLLEGLKEHPGWAVLEDYWFNRTKGTKESVLNGNAGTFEEYKQRSGWLLGIQDVLDTAKFVRTMVNTEAENRELMRDE